MNLPRKEPQSEVESTLRQGAWFGATAILAYLALFKLLLHLLTNSNYGYFRDELYYMAAGERLDLGYVDFPPFVALVTAFSRLLLGDSMVALRFLPALAGALVVVLGGLTKITMLYFGFAVFVALLLTSSRRCLLTPWPWLGGAIAVLFLLPYVYWQITHGWPTVEFWADYGEKVDPASPIEFLVEQVLTMQPLTLPLWLAGLYYYLFSRDGWTLRPLGLIYVLLFALFAIQNAKFYFLAPAYPMLFAAGALSLECLVRRRSWTWLKPAYAAVLLVGGIALAPMVVPILPVETLASITGAGVKQERREEGQLPQHFADRFGWENMVATVAGVYDSLPVEDRSTACVFTANYGEAGAIDFFGPKFGLPEAISGHNSYY